MATPVTTKPASVSTLGNFDTTTQLLKDALTKQASTQAAAKQEMAAKLKEIDTERTQIASEMKPPDVTARYFADNKLPSEAVTSDASNTNHLYLNLHKLMAPPKEELINRGEAFRKILPILAAFAALGTIASRGNITVGIRALTGGMQGLMEGNRLKYQEAYQTWHSTTQSAIEDNNTRVKALQEVLHDQQLSVAQKIALLKVHVSELPPLEKAMGSGDLKEIEGVISSLHTATVTTHEQFKHASAMLKPAPAPDNAQVGSAMSYLIHVGQTTSAPNSTSTYIRQDLPGLSSSNAPPQMISSAASALAAQALAMQEDAAKKGQTLNWQQALHSAYGQMIKDNQLDWNSLTQALPSNWTESGSSIF